MVQKTYAEKRAAGLCVRCGEPTGGGARCARHAAEHNDARKRAYLKDKKARRCVVCRRETARRGKTRCAECAQDARNYAKAG